MFILITIPPKSPPKKYLNGINGINITTDVYIKSNYSISDVVKLSDHVMVETASENSEVGKEQINYNANTTDYEEQNFIKDEGKSSSKETLFIDSSQTPMETEIDIDSRDRHQPGIKPPK